MRIGEKANLEPGKPLREVFGEALLQICREDSRVVVLDGDLGNSTKADLVRAHFPDRFLNLGIAESNMVGVGAGLASCGFIPFVVSFSSFLLCNAYDQIRLAVAMSRTNVKIVGSHGGITLGKDGPTQMGIEDLALMGGLPTMVILVPCDAVSMKQALKKAIEYQGPVFIRSSRYPMPQVYRDDGDSFTIGKANVLRDGDDLTIVACGLMVACALDAWAELREKGIHARVIDLHTLRPLDRETLVRAARETKAIVTAEEHLLHGGMGTTVARIVAEEFPCPMQFVGLEDLYVESADPDELLEKYGLTSKAIVQKCQRVLEMKGR
ncbi:MAG: transketolase C-terminal domain-containing protein [Atribacterota bacterium]